jgi:HTH-type transcriptional regulator/antitoxin HigA
MTDLLDFTKPNILRNEAEYQAAVSEIDRLLDADPQSSCDDHERLEFLSVLVQAYEDAHFPVGDLVTPQEAVEFMLEQKGQSRKDLADWLGGESRMTEFLHDAGSLTLRQIEVLREKLGIPTDLLIGRPEPSVMSA